MAAIVPAAPKAFISPDLHQPFQDHIQELAVELSAGRGEREAAFTLARNVQHAAQLALHRRHSGDSLGASAQLSNAMSGVAQLVPLRTSDEDGLLCAAIQQVCVAQIFDTFLESGTLGMRPSAAPDWAATVPPRPRVVGEKHATPPVASDASTCYMDEEWLGALISSAHEIGRYANAAATAGDAASLAAARGVVVALHDAMADFDLRNGSLRRSFDSLKYVVRRLEDTTYELSLFPPAASSSTAAASAAAVGRGGVGPADAAAAESPAVLLDVDALSAAREQYAALDAAREAVIKKCREPQKQSKQAITALHRADWAAARKSLSAARAGALAILGGDLVAQPSLRSQGAVRSMLEELAEAALFEAWLADGSGGDAAGGEGRGAAPTPQLAGRRLLLRSEESLLGGRLQPSEYLGGLCDLVGEIGRFAVRRATVRDADAVRQSLSSALAVQSAVLALGSSAPRGLHKKGDALRTAVRKLETLLYELSLVDRSGRVREAPTDHLPADPSQAPREGDDE